MALRNYTNNAPQLALTTAVNTSAVTLAVTSTAGYPAAPFTLTLERGTVNQEVTRCTALTGTTFTVTRDSTPKAHAIGASVEHTSEAADYSEANIHVNQTTPATDPHPQYLKESGFTAKGQILIATGAGTYAALTLGTNGHVPIADSATATGWKWGQLSGSTSISDNSVSMVKLTDDVERSLVRRMSANPVSPQNGELIYNTTAANWHGYIGSVWVKMPYNAGKINISTAAPSGGEDRDLWFRY